MLSLDGRNRSLFARRERSRRRPLAGVDLLLHDGEYLPDEYRQRTRGWGHSNFADTVRLAAAAGVGRLVLWHLNQDRSDSAADALQAEARQQLAAAGCPARCDVARTGMQFEL